MRAMRLAKLIVGGMLLAGALAGPARAQEQVPVEPNADEKQRQRLDWFYRQRAYPQGFIPSEARVAAVEHLHRLQQLQRDRRATAGALAAGEIDPLAAWTLIGPQPTNTPFNVPVESGRVSALVVDPRNANVVYAGASIGGVWKSTDGGQELDPAD